VTINGSSTLALGASQSVASLSGTAGSSVTLGSNTLTINGSSTTTYSGAISGAGNLVKNGSGTQTLAGATTYTGATTVNSGTLTAASYALQGGQALTPLGSGALTSSGSSLLDGNWPAFMNITASPTDKVRVQNDDNHTSDDSSTNDDSSTRTGPYYLNTGIAPFLEYDIVYNLEGETLTLVPASAPVPEIDPAGFGSVFALVAAAFGLIEQRGRQKRPAVTRG
jgi:autotransporter-associated beta strand protein